MGGGINGQNTERDLNEKGRDVSQTAEKTGRNLKTSG